MNGEVFEHEAPQVYLFWLKFWRYVIAGSEIAGGFLGLYSLFLSGRAFGQLVFLLMFGSFFTVSIAAGILLALKKPLGIPLSLVAQAIQLLALNVPGFVYLFVCGPQVLIGAVSGDSSMLGFGYSYSASYLIKLGAPEIIAPPAGPDVIGAVPTGAITGVNIVPILAIVALLHIRKQAREAKS